MTGSSKLAFWTDVTLEHESASEATLTVETTLADADQNADALVAPARTRNVMAAMATAIFARFTGYAPALR